MKPALLGIMGPTGSGKSDLAIQLAKKLNAEIISADSMLVYRGMDILTAKPSREERDRIPHHLIDCVEPESEFSVADYLQRVSRLLEAPSSEGKVYILVGGSGLYVRALLRGISDKPKADAALREGLLKEAEIHGMVYLRERLKTLDPQYEKTALDDRRLLRALEVYEMTGKTMTEWDNNTPQAGVLDRVSQCKLFGLNWSREKLKERIRTRTEAMMEGGVVEEIRRLAERKLSRTARQAIGFREVESYLKKEITQDQIAPLILKNTAALAKRQMTWFRSERDVVWLEENLLGNWKEVVNEIQKEWSR